MPEESLGISWPSAPGTVFTIHSSENLPNWTTVVTSGVPASAGSSTCYNVGIPDGFNGFYRVELED